MLTAVMFYTRIPCPKSIGHEYVSLSIRYLSLIGWITGGVCAGAVILLSFIFPVTVSVVAALAISVLLTGAFHEDGFADVCDGFGGGWTKEKILLIMKDSRVGTYGVTGLILLFGLKFSATWQLLMSVSSAAFIFLIISAHSLSRLMAVIIIYSQPYAREDGYSKAGDAGRGMTFSSLVIATFFAMVPFVFLLLYTNVFFALLLLPLVLITVWLRRYFKKWIGGYTGDCLGATQQINEVAFLMLAMVIWKFS